MNHLNVNLLGGMYLESEDWMFNQNGIKDALKGLVSMVGGNVHLSGIESISPVGGNWDYPEGYIAIEGEIYYVPAASVPANGAHWYWEVVESYDPAGYEVFQDGGAPQNTYVVRTAKLATYPTAQSETATRKSTVNMKSLSDFVLNRIQNNSNRFSLAQQWKEYDNALNIPGGVLSLGTDANSFRINVPNGGGGLTEIVNDMNLQNGTIITLNLQGSIGDLFAVIHGNNIEAEQYNYSGGMSFTGAGFKANASIQFIKSNGKWRLITPGIPA